MKKFTDTQKKWALTATMIAALGCSVSFNPHVEGYAALDMASKSSDVVTDKFTLDDKELKVHYIKKGKDQITAVVTGGSDCDVCNTYVIDKKLKTDSKSLEDIQVELVAQIAERHGEESEEDSEETDERSEREERLAKDREEHRERASDRKKKAAQAKEDYKKIKRSMDLAYCEESADPAACLTDEFLSTIDKKKPYSEKAVFDYFSENIEPQLIDLLLDASPSTERGYRYTNRATQAIKALKQFMREIPAAYPSLKESVVYLASQSIHASASLQRDYINRFATTGDPMAKEAAKTQDQWTQQLVNNLQHVVSPVAIRNGMTNGSINMSQAEAIYQNNFALYANSIRAGTKLWTVVGQTPNLGAYTLPDLQYANVLGLEGIQSDVYRGVPAPDLTTRLMSDQRGGQVIIQTVPANSQHLQFGTPQPISPATQQQLLELRASQQYHRAQ